MLLIAVVACLAARPCPGQQAATQPASNPAEVIQRDPSLPEPPSTSPATSTSPASSTASSRAVEGDPLRVPEVQPDVRGRKSEVVGFIVQGRRLAERLTVDDLDSLVLPDGRRLLPIYRLVRVFLVPIHEEAMLATFQPEGAGKVVIDLGAKRIEINGKSRPFEPVEATSEITLKPDLYVAPELVSEILNMQLEWDGALYEYRVHLDRTLSIWKQKQSASLFSIRALYQPPELTEMQPQAALSDQPVHFVDFSWSPSVVWHPAPVAGQASRALLLPSPYETIWGRMFEGRYKVVITQPGAAWDDTPEGLRWTDQRPHALTVGWAEWVYRLPAAEVAVGDSSVGVGELVFPYLTLTGVRINGLTGFSRSELEADKSGLGLQTFFSKTHLFEGNAPVGSTVELYLNDRLLDSQTVLADPKAPPGMGTYRFEDVRLPAGIPNETAIVITEPNGNKTRQEKVIMGSPLLVPQGKSTYLAVAGTRRDLASPNNGEIQVGQPTGSVAAGRVMTGLTDRLSVGGLFGFQREFYLPEIGALESFFTPSPLTPTQPFLFRAYPRSSAHYGGLFTLMPFDRLQVSGDAAGSQSDGPEAYNDSAFRLRSEFLPAENISFNADFLSLGPNYFDGQDINLYDRRAGAMRANWSFLKKWRLEAAAGVVGNNVDGQLDQTLRTGYQSLLLETTAVPRTTLTFTLNAFEPNWEPGRSALGELKVRTTPLPGLDIMAQVSRGEPLSLGDQSTFLSGLKLPGVPNATYPMWSLTARKLLPKNNAVGFTFVKSDYEEWGGISHDVAFQLKYPLRVSTSLLEDFRTDLPESRYAFRHRLEFFLDQAGNNRVGLELLWEDRLWQVTAVLNLKDLFAFDKARPVRVDNKYIRADAGAVHGHVFLDYNADGKMDPGEPGLPEVKVRLGDINAALTAGTGYYILPAVPDVRKVRVSMEAETLPAIYSPTHGTQLASIAPGCLTEVNLGATPLIAVSGRVYVQQTETAKTPLAGARVVLIDPGKNRFVADSITAENGSFYLGDLRAGDYILKVEPASLPRGARLLEPERPLKIVGTKDFQEIKTADFLVTPPAPQTQQSE